MQEILARGVNFVYTKQFIVNKHGIETWKLLLQSLSENARKTTRVSVLIIQGNDIDYDVGIKHKTGLRDCLHL